MIKDIAVHLSTEAVRDPAPDCAVSLASLFGAHLAGIAFVYDPVIPPTFMGEAVPPELIETQQNEAKSRAEAVIARFSEQARRQGIAAETIMLNASAAGTADTFGRLARRFDLSVVKQAEPGSTAPDDLIIEAGLFESGRPVLVVPYIHKDGLTLERAIVGWDGSRSAARALGDALPILARAKTVEVVIVAAERDTGEEIEGADIAQHLARHGLKVEVKRIVAGEVDVANTILSHAADTAADFIVMGGYDHSRWRELVLGGVTRGILATMTVPTLMSH
jgi:nucleotide-binding universal stress UspA family protein